mmetsp:Transcript_21990/g.55008  ORF Transcript_21990/g.55008 Transcript_21990/m.55008 type:complete len:203 (+) Transcript_21990:181-789(+)
MGRRHGSATECVVAVVRHRRVDTTAGCGYVHCGVAVAREVRQIAFGGDGGDRDNIRNVVVGWEAWHLVVIVGLVSRRCCEEHPGNLSVLNGRTQCRAGAATAPRVACDLGSVSYRVVNGSDCIRRPTRSMGVQELQGHQAHAAPCHPGNSNSIVADARDRACTMRAVHVVIHGIPIFVGEVSAVDIVNVAILIVIDPIVRNL